MKQKKPALNKELLISMFFTIIVVVALIVIFLLSGKRQNVSSALDASAATPSPTAISADKQASVTSGTKSSVPYVSAPTPSPVPFGVSVGTFIDTLRLSGICVAEKEDGLDVSAEEDPIYYHTGHLTLDPHDTNIQGFVLSYSAVDTSVDDDGSAISAALMMTSPDELIDSQADAMENVYYTVFSAFDPSGTVPSTIRNEWCARLLSFQHDKTHKAYEDTCGKFRFSLYTYGTGTDMLLCCSVQYRP